MMRNILLFSSITLAFACGRVVTPAYEGTPIATVGGQLTAATDVPLPETVHLAVAWYPRWLNDGVTTAPKAIVTQEVTYRGAFPQRYTFDFYAPPPLDALVDSPPGEAISGHAALGFLLAYEDLNGNGELDPMHADGTGGDRVLGSSWDWHLDGTPTAGTPTGYAIFYVETAPANDPQLAAQGLQRGYNLIGVEAPVPFDTPIPIALTAAPTLAFQICEESFSGLSPEPCGIVIPQPDQPQDGPAPHFNGTVELVDGVGEVNAYVFDAQGHQITDAAISLESTAIPYDEVNQRYHLANAPFAAGDTVHLRAVVSGGIGRSYTVPVPGDFSITAPAAHAQIRASEGVYAMWTASTPSDHYTLLLDTGDPLSSTVRVVSSNQTYVSLDSTWTGEAMLRVSANYWPGGSFNDGFQSSTTHAIPVTVVP